MNLGFINTIQKLSVCFKTNQRLSKIKRVRSASKNSIASFSTLTEYLVSIPSRHQSSINAEWYTTKCLSKVFTAVSNKRLNTALRWLLLNHDNVPAHSANKTRDSLNSTPIKLLGHPAYSPDLHVWLTVWLLSIPYIKIKYLGRTMHRQRQRRKRGVWGG